MNDSIVEQAKNQKAVLISSLNLHMAAIPDSLKIEIDRTIQVYDRMTGIIETLTEIGIIE